MEVLVSALISSVVGAVVAAVVSKLKMLRSASEEAKREAAELKKLITQNTIMTCRLAIYNDKFSIDEKLDAYDLYSSLGQNHDTKTFMDGVVGCDVDEYLERHRRKEH